MPVSKSVEHQNSWARERTTFALIRKVSWSGKSTSRDGIMQIAAAKRELLNRFPKYNKKDLKARIESIAARRCIVDRSNFRRWSKNNAIRRTLESQKS